MPLTVEQFTERVTSSGILPAEQLSEWLAGLPADAPARSDAEALARELVKQKKLTKFQAEQIYAGKGASLSLGNYLILDKLGEGGMGMVLKAWHRRMERTVALKVIAPKVVKDPTALKRFQREVVAAAKLTHPNIVAAYDADEAKGTHFLVMEYVEGSDLSSWVKEHGPLPIEQAVNCIIQAARGLAFAHDKGVVHRDIKPHNLLIEIPHGEPEGVSPRTGAHVRGLTPSGSPMQFPTVKILDMGLARIDVGFGGSAEQADLTRSGAMMGTVDYMSPEQAMDSKHADARSDIYSLGCTLFYLITGHVAFEADTVMKRLTAHQSAPPPSLVEQMKAESRRSGASQSALPLDSGLAVLDAVFRRMVAKKPDDRPQSMLQVIAELERCLTSDSATISVASSSNPVAKPSAPTNVPSIVSIRDSDTIVDSSSDSRTNGPSDATIVLDGSVGKNPPADVTTSSIKSRKMILISVATVVAVMLAIAVAMSGKSPNPSDDKLVANPPNPNPQSSASSPSNTEVREPAEPNRTPMDTALMFDGDDRVEIPSLTFDSQGSYTLEGFIASPVKADHRAGLVFGMPEQSYLSFTRLSDWRWVYQPQKRNMGVEIAIAGAAARPERTHLACVRDGQTHHLFVGGKLFHKVSEKPSPAAGTSPFLIGSEFRGVIDELRVSRVARYKVDFLPPARHEPDADTLALYHFDEGQGDQLVDSSGNKHHGKITGAKWVKANDSSAIAPALAKAPFDAQQARTHQEAWAKHLGTTIETTNSVGAKMILIPPGEFLMGTSDGQIAAAVLDAVERERGQDVANAIRINERPQHRVVITKPFLMGATEVTVGQFRKFVEATRHQTYAEKNKTDAVPATYLNPSYPITDESPVAVVNGDDVAAYCRWLSEKEQATYRLPTEAEWEYACRAGTTTAFSFGETLLDSHEWSIRNSDSKPQPVATRQPNPWGLFDIHGNLSEWCQDRFDENWYQQSPLNDPLNDTSGPHHVYVVRGGHFGYHCILRSAYRTRQTHNVPHPTTGFRVVREFGPAAVAPAKNVANQDQTPIGGSFSLQLDPNGRIDIPLRLPANSSVTYEFELTRKPPDPTNLHHQLATLIRGSDLKQFQDKFTLSYYSSPRFSINALPGRERFFLAATVTETKLRLFINGLQVTEDSPPVPVSMSDLNSVYLGMSPGAPSNFRAYDAPLHRFRLSRGERYSADYDPAGEWLPDEQTLVLYDFRRGGTADQVLDLSANKKHGKLVDAKWIQPGMAAVPSTDVDRAAATWVIEQGGHVWLKHSNTKFDKVADLPAGKIEVRAVELNKRLQGADADLVALHGLKDMEWFKLDSTRATPAALAGLERSGMKWLSLGSFSLTDAHLAAIARLPHLNMLFLAGSGLTPQHCRTIATQTRLEKLNLTANPLIDDAAIEAFGQLHNLALVELNGTKVTAAGIAKLRQALPDCDIRWDGPPSPPQTKPWTDWLGPKLKQGKFFDHFDGRQGWQQENDGVTTTNEISGCEVLPPTTRDGAVRLTYLSRNSKLTAINARDRTTNGKRELYIVEDQGTQILIALIQDGAYKNLILKPIPASIPKDAQRTLEFRIVGDTLTATVNGSVVATVKDSTLTEGNFALVALKGVLVQKVEYQKLDEPK